MGGTVTMPQLIQLENLTIRFGHHIALHDVSGSFQTGSLTAIAGPNGAGKSTLLKAIVGIEIRLDRLEGKAKLGQNREPRDRLGAADTLAVRGHDGLSQAMRQAGPLP